MPHSDCSGERFRYELARRRHQGDWVSVGEERSYVHQCKLLGALYVCSILVFWGYACALGVYELTFAALIGLAFGALGAFRGHWQRRWIDCSRLLTLGVWAVISSAACIDGQLDSPILWLLPLAPMVAGHMLDKREWIICTLLCCTTVLSFYVYGRYYEPNLQLVQSDYDVIFYRVLALCIYVAFTLFTSLVAQHDLALLQTKQEDLERAREASEMAAVAKSRFLANMSHEIRTPMHGIVGTTALLQRLSLDPQEREAADTIYSCGEALLALLTNVLDYSKLEARKLVSCPHAFSPASLVQRLAGSWRPRMERREVKLEVQVNCPDDLMLLGDGDLLGKVLSYLLDNAVRYGLSAPVTLSLDADPATGDLSLVVQDTGPGIPPAELARVMAPFERGRGLDGDNIEGIGLGLALAKSLAQLVGGELVVEPGPEGGVRASVRVRFMVVSSTKSMPEPQSPKSQETPRVLVVDDQLINLTIARAELEALGFEVKTATGGQDAIKRAMAQPFDLILMDLEMPDLSGWEASRQIASQPGPNQSTPVIALSAHDAGEVQELREKGGMVGHLGKPFDEASLAELLKRHGLCPPDPEAFEQAA